MCVKGVGSGSMGGWMGLPHSSLSSITFKETTSPREEPPGAETSEVRVKVNKSDHRFIVGQQRKNIVEIFNLTGVTIEVPKVNDPSEEVILRGDKFQIGSAITLMYTKVLF